jgi:hypothetical protein
VQDHWITLDQVRWAALGVALAAAGLFVLVPRRFALVLTALVALYFACTTWIVENGRHGIHQASVGKRWAGIRVAEPDWLDRAVGRDASIAFVRTGRATDEALWENEFFNRSLGPVYSLDRMRRPDPLPETQVTRRADGRLVVAGLPLATEYALVDGSLDLEGTVVAEDEQVGLRLYRVAGPLVAPVRVTGLYGDSWSGRSVTYRRRDCSGGLLAVTLGSDPSLFRGPQTVTAGGRRAVVQPAGPATLTVPLRPDAGGVCSVRFDVARTAVPARTIPGSTDRRVLGAHFVAFDYRP